jgi:hypothetical protein
MGYEHTTISRVADLLISRSDAGTGLAVASDWERGRGHCGTKAGTRLFIEKVRYLIGVVGVTLLSAMGTVGRSSPPW